MNDTANTPALLKPIIQQALVFHRWWERELLIWSPATPRHCKEEPDMLLVIIAATLLLITCGFGIFLFLFFLISLPLFLQKLFFPVMWESSLQHTSKSYFPSSSSLRNFCFFPPLLLAEVNQSLSKNSVCFQGNYNRSETFDPGFGWSCI